MVIGCDGCLHLKPLYFVEAGTIERRCMRPVEIMGEQFWPSRGLSLGEEAADLQEPWRSPRCGPDRKFREARKDHDNG